MTWRRLVLWPRGLAGQIAAIVILALVIAQGLTALLVFVLQPHREPPRMPFETATRVAVILKALDAASPSQRPQIAGAFTGGLLAVTIVGLGDIEPTPPLTGEPAFFHRALEHELGRPSPVRVIEQPEASGRLHPLSVTARLTDGTLIAVETTIMGPPRFYELGLGPFFFYLPFLALSIAMLTIWATRRITAPLRAFADAAERLGNERSAPPVPERGPLELRRAAQSFNKMQDQVKRFVADRTRMLAAISHDLRTPITRLRLRVESVVEEGCEQQKMLEDLRRMDAMVASALSFLRDATQEEAVELVDVASLVQSVCDEFVDTGRDAKYEGPSSLELRCRPRMLGRAVTNLVENAIKFGGSATVGLGEAASGDVLLQVDDQGPGIPDAEKRRAFDPFYRLDPARHPETGGVGLGLSIAQTIVQVHGGKIALKDRQPQGLRVEVSLPLRNEAQRRR